MRQVERATIDLRDGWSGMLVDVPLTPTPLRVRADLSAQIRVRPSSTLIAEVEQIVGQGAVSLR